MDFKEFTDKWRQRIADEISDFARSMIEVKPFDPSRRNLLTKAGGAFLSQYIPPDILKLLRDWDPVKHIVLEPSKLREVAKIWINLTKEINCSTGLPQESPANEIEQEFHDFMDDLRGMARGKKLDILRKAGSADELEKLGNAVIKRQEDLLEIRLKLEEILLASPKDTAQELDYVVWETAGDDLRGALIDGNWVELPDGTYGPKKAYDIFDKPIEEVRAQIAKTITAMREEFAHEFYSLTGSIWPGTPDKTIKEIKKFRTEYPDSHESALPQKKEPILDLTPDPRLTIQIINSTIPGWQWSDKLDSGLQQTSPKSTPRFTLSVQLKPDAVIKDAKDRDSLESKRLECLENIKNHLTEQYPPIQKTTDLCNSLNINPFQLEDDVLIIFNPSEQLKLHLNQRATIQQADMAEWKKNASKLWAQAVATRDANSTEQAR